MIQFTTNNETI